MDTSLTCHLTSGNSIEKGRMKMCNSWMGNQPSSGRRPEREIPSETTSYITDIFSVLSLSSWILHRPFYQIPRWKCDPDWALRCCGRNQLGVKAKFILVWPCKDYASDSLRCERGESAVVMISWRIFSKTYPHFFIVLMITIIVFTEILKDSICANRKSISSIKYVIKKC